MQELVSKQPSKLQEIYDHQTKSKLPVDFEAFGKPNVFFKGFKKPMTLDNQISCVQGSDMVARIPRFCYGPSSSQTMLYFSNTGPDYINPSKDTRVADRGDLKDRIADHMMDGYKDRLKEFLDEQEAQANKVVQMDKDKKLARKELEDMANEMFIKD